MWNQRVRKYLDKAGKVPSDIAQVRHIAEKSVYLWLKRETRPQSKDAISFELEVLEPFEKSHAADLADPADPPAKKPPWLASLEEKIEKFGKASATGEKRPWNVYTLEKFKAGLEAHAFSAVEVPVVEGEAALGEPRAISDHDIKEAFQIPAGWVGRGRGPGDYALVPVDGDSMEPLLHSGDLVCVDYRSSDFRSLSSGKLVLTRVAAGNVVKRLVKKSGMLILQSENPRIKPVPIKEGDAIIGEVVWVIKRNLPPTKGSQ